MQGGVPEDRPAAGDQCGATHWGLLLHLRRPPAGQVGPASALHAAVCMDQSAISTCDGPVKTQTCQDCGPSCMPIDAYTHSDSAVCAAVLSTTLSWRCLQTAAMGAGMQA